MYLHDTCMNPPKVVESWILENGLDQASKKRCKDQCKDSKGHQKKVHPEPGVLKGRATELAEIWMILRFPYCKKTVYLFKILYMYIRYLYIYIYVYICINNNLPQNRYWYYNQTI